MTTWISQLIARLRQLPTGKRANSTVRSAAEEAAPPAKPIIRTIHHFSCTGGTIIAKCIAAQPNVVLLNEIDPYSTLSLLDSNGKARFQPRDVISLLYQSGTQVETSLIEKIFLNNMQTLAQHTSESSLNLVLREHSHGAYLTGNEIRHPQSIREILFRAFVVKSVVTVRNPIDSYLSLLKNKWLHFSPACFDEYCRRYLCFIRYHNQTQILKYEDFVSQPNETLQAICNALNINFSEDFIRKQAYFNFSGDSGRASSVISPRPRQPYSLQLEHEINTSENYRSLCEALGYPPTLTAQKHAIQTT